MIRLPIGVSIPSTTGLVLNRLYLTDGLTAAGLNPFNYRAGTEPAPGNVLHTNQRRLNPFNYRAGTEHNVYASEKLADIGLNPFNYRAGTEHIKRKAYPVTDMSQSLQLQGWY